MAIYLLNILTIIIYSLFIKNKKAYVVLVSLQLFLILALRSITLGEDLIHYCQGYYYIKTLNFTTLISKLHFLKSASLVYPFVFESGYTTFCWIISKFNFSYHTFLGFCAAINIYAFAKLIYKYSENPCLSYIIFCTFEIYFYFFGILRQSLALSFFILSFIFSNDNKKIKAVIFCCLAFLFHRTSIIMVPLLILGNKKPITRKKAIWCLLGIVPFLLFSKYIYAFIHIIMDFFGKGYAGTGFRIDNLTKLLFLIYIIIIIFADFDKLKDNKIFSKCIYALIFGILMGILGSYNETLGRSVQLFTPFLILLIPYVIKLYSNQKITFLIEGVIVILLIGFMIYYLGQQKIVPYRIEENLSIFD